jgi:Cys-rich four helix bundle protein (predicted Tat secretion target)
MQRRDFLSAAALATAATALNPGNVFAGETTASLSAAASDCAAKGEACLQHCVESMSSGSKVMADCAASVREMTVYCEALSKAAARKSKHLKALAKITRDVCLECEKQCRKHEKMEVCKTCADACAECAKACMSA